MLFLAAGAVFELLANGDAFAIPEGATKSVTAGAVLLVTEVGLMKWKECKIT